MTLTIMLLIVTVLALEVMYGATFNESNFFDKNSTNALRGLWCIVVVLVHIPLIYQNEIQELIGSFAFVGVTFFFMFSGYGMKLNIKNGKLVDGVAFWKKRLIRLLLPCGILNIFIFIYESLNNNVSYTFLFKLDSWVKWLLLCYIIFWAIYQFENITESEKDFIICLLIIMVSIFSYINRSNFNTIWCVEVLGFIYGILLAHLKDWFILKCKKNWNYKCMLLCLISLTVGITYTQLKIIPFWGDYLLKVILGIVIILFLLCMNCKIKIGNKMSYYLGGISYEIYITHRFVLKVMSQYELNSGAYILLVLVITIIIATIIKYCSGVISRMIERIKKKIIK